MCSYRPLFREVELLWEALADAIAQPNRKLRRGQLDETSGRLVELLVFLKMCRGRGIVSDDCFECSAPDGSSAFRLDEWSQTIAGKTARGLVEVRSEDELADKTVGTGLPPLGVDGDLFRRALERFDRSDAAGNLAQLPVEVLGLIHERILGRRLVQGTQDRFKAKRCKDAKKAAGIYYTPGYVVDYIVDKSLGVSLETLSGKPAAVVDPACGCGAFLLAACRRLHERGQSRRRLHGVDLDPQAVLVARRSLWLELFVTADAPGAQSLAECLTKNVRWGDALVGADVQRQSGTFDVVLV